MTTDERIQKALESARKNDANNRDAARRLPGSSASGAGASGDRAQQALAAARQKDKTTTRTLTPSRTPSSTPASPLPSFATGSGNTVESVLGRFSGRGGVEAIKSPDSWSSAGDAELGLKAWSGQLEGYEKKLTELSGSIANTENRLKNLQTTVKTAEDAAAYDELYAGYERMIADYNGVVNDINRVQDKYSAGVERYRDILSGGMERADAAAAEAKRLEDENSRLQRQANLIRIYEMSGTSSSSAAAPIEAQIEQNAERIKKLRAEESQNKMQYYSSLALMEDYAGLSSPASVTGDSRYEYINDIDNARYRNEHTTDPSGAPVALRRYQYLTEDEIKIYNYLYASQGKDAADRFLEDMGPALTERQGAAQYEELGALGKALYWIPAGLDQFGSGIRQLFQREAVPVSSTQITSQLIQQEAQEKSPVLGTLYTLGTTLSNMAPSILASALGSWALGAAGLSAGTASAIGRAAGGTALGASAGGNAYTQKLNEGYSSEAAQNYATLVGASEGALQYLLGGIGALSKSGTGRIAAKIAGLDNALGRVAHTVSGSTAARLLGSMISEGTEEGLQELLEPAFAAIIFDEEYEADFEDAAYAFLLGALSAGIIEGPAAIDYARRPAGFSFRDMDGYADNGVDYFEGANTLEEVEARYRDLARQYHPDLGGDAATMAEINRQRTMARAFFRGRAEAAAADEAADTTPEAAANTERADGVTRRLTAGRATEETTPETVRAPIEDQAYAEAGGIVLPTADTAGDFSPRAEVGATETPTLEAPRAAVPETNAAGNIVLPTADEIMNGGISNGQQGQQWQQRRNQVSDGDGGRFSGQRAGVEAGELARGAEQAARPTQQVGTALARQARVRGLRLERVSSASLGLENGTEARSLQVIPEAAYDDELRAVSADVYRRTGQRVTFVVGNIQVRAAGKTRAVRGVWTPGGIYVQADNAGYSAAQIAAHEVYHDLAANTPGLDADVKQRIIERYGEDEFRRVAQVYIERLRGVYDVPDGAEYDPALMDTYFASILQEIYADAYAGINAFGAHAERFADAARVTVAERTGMATGETEAATRNRTGPPAERNGVGYITEEKETTAVKAKNPSPGTDSSTATISTDRVAENALPVKENVPRNELADSESKDAVQELPKGAAENGSLTKATSTASEDIIRDAGESVNARFSIDEDYEREDVPDYFRGNPYWLETEHAAKAAGYPEIDGVQIMPYKTWVRSKEQGNYGFVVGLAPRDRLVVSFWNKDSGKRAVVPLEQTDIEPVQGAYQMEQNELASLLESEPETVERMELSPEDEAEYQRWLTEKYGFKAGVRANTALLALPKKAQTEYKRSVSRLVNDLGKSLGVPYHAGRSELRPIAEQIADEYFREGTVSEESGAELFEEAYANGIIRDDEFYRENKPILDYLRTTPIRVSETVKSDIADFNDWRKRQFGRLRISEDGRGVEQVYGELSEMAPGFFPEDITKPTDQLERIADVADSIRISERTLDEYYGPDAAEYKRWAYDEFKQQIGRAYESLRTVRQIALEQDAKRAELKRLLEIAETGPTEGELDRVKRLWDEGKKARRAYERAVRRNLLSDRDRQLLGQLMRGEISAEDIPSTANRAGIAEIYAAKREYEAFAGALKEFNTKRRAALRAQADDILAGASRMKDKRRGASYMRETQERNARYVFDGPTAEKIIETYFTPVHKNEARRTVYKTQLRDRVRELDLDRKARKGDAVSEAAAVQIYGEALDNISMIEEQLKRGGSDWRNGHSLSEWRALVDDLWAKSPGLDKEKITAAVEEFRKIYDELFSLMNQVRIRNGYEPVDYRHGYFPHFDDAKGESLLGRAFKAANMKDVPLKDRLAALVGKGLDVNTEVNALPTSINGLTHTFKPGIRWVGNIMRRQGFDTTFDAVEGFDRYIEGVSDVIYHTDDIQRLRALASQIRYRTTEPGIQAQVDAIRADPGLSEDKKDTDVRAKLEEGKYELSNYVNNIEEYTNLLANKRSTMDRGVEQLIGRDYYNFAIALENRVAANMVAVNPGSWLTNFIPITQAWAEVSAGDILTSMRDTLSAMVKDDGFRTKSDFLTNRMGSDPLVLSWTQDASKILTKPMEWIDMFTSETVVRARYNSNLKLGMSETAAMEEADSFAASLIADRSKGALPTIFESRNPFTKLFTQFQVEVNNQLSYLYRDLPRNLKERGKKSLAVALLKFMLGAWLYDELYEAIVGRRPALDPLNMLNELSGDLFGYALPNTIELAVDMITGNDVSLATERTDAATALANFGKELGGQLPFIGGPVFDGGRLPIQSAFKDPLAYLLLPFGGGQLSKFVKGVNAVAEGGVYGEDAESNPTLKYPVERNVKDALTAMVFGTTSTKGGQEWIDRGFSRLTAKQTAAYAALLGGGIDAYDAFDVVMDIKGTEKTETQSANDIKREKISALDISDELKATLYSNLITDDYDEAIDDMLRRGVDWDGIMGVVTNSKYGVERYNKLVDAGVSPGNAARITEALYSLEPEDGKKSVSQVQQYGAIDKLDGLTDEEKLAAIGTIMGTDATTESGNPSQYSKLTDAIESGLSLTDALEQRENGTLDDYLEFYSAGMKSDAAVDAAETLDAMPEDASTVERYLAIAEMPLSERDKDAALSAIMSDSAYEKYQAARSKGIDTYEYVAFLRAISDFSGDGKQQRVWDYINSLPLSTAQKDQLHYAAGYKESSLAKTPWH